jgi:hypothetical protein
MMILVEISTNGYDVIAESRSRTKLEEMRAVMEGFEIETVEEIEECRFSELAGYSECSYNYEDSDDHLNEFMNPFEYSSSLVIVPRSVIGRRGDLTVAEALQESYPLPSMLMDKLREINYI